MVERGKNPGTEELVLVDVSSGAARRANDDPRFPDGAVTLELFSGEIDLKPIGELVPVVDFVVLVPAGDVCNE